MNELTMGTGEAKFADIIWENEPIASSDLAKRSEAAMGWKKSTAFTVLKRLCDKGIFKNEKGSVTSLMTRAEFYGAQSERFVEEAFGGSLPAFIAAFACRRDLSEDAVAELRRIVAEYEGGK